MHCTVTPHSSYYALSAPPRPHVLCVAYRAFCLTGGGGGAQSYYTIITRNKENFTEFLRPVWVRQGLSWLGLWWYVGLKIRHQAGLAVRHDLSLTFRRHALGQGIVKTLCFT